MFVLMTKKPNEFLEFELMDFFKWEKFKIAKVRVLLVDPRDFQPQLPMEGMPKDFWVDEKGEAAP